MKKLFLSFLFLFAIINVKAQSPLTITVNSGTICSSASFTMTASGATSYTWFPGGLTGNSITIAPTASTSYTVYGSAGASSGSTTANVTVLPNPTVTVNSPTICSAISATLVANSSASFPSYAWSDGSVMPSITVTPTITTNYSVTITDANGCTSTATTNVTVGTILYTVSNATLDCNNPSVSISLTTTTTVGSITYSWNGPGIVQGWLTPHPVVVLPGTYSFTLTNTSNVCITTGSAIVVSNTVAPTVAINSPTICFATSATLTANSSASFPSYAWSDGSAMPSIIVTPTITTNYSVTITDANGCANTATTDVTVESSPIITVNSATICSGQTATLTASGATSYTWSPPANLSSTSGSIVYANPSSSSIYTIQGIDANGCIGISSANVNVSTMPPILIVNNATVCIGTSTILTASGADFYGWGTGANTNSIVVTPTISTSYFVIGINGCGSVTATPSVTVNQTCQDVWPGDANSDGIADNLDILELGLHYTLTGTPRALTSNVWQSYYSSNWSGTITNGKNVNHSNCNGDGIINDDDTLAIYNNYSLTHAFKPTQSTTNPQLTIVPDQSLVAKGTWGTSSIYLADATTPINTINGLAFTVNFDNTLIDPNSIYIVYNNSFIDVSHQNLYFRKTVFSNGKIYTATTHTVNNNISGFGKIATLHYKILSSLNTDQVFNIGLTNANQSNALGAITPLTAGTTTLMAIGASVGLEENSFINSISISPNPTNGLVNLKSKLAIEKIEVINITGQLIINESVYTNNHILHLEGLVNGIYFLNIYQDNHIVKREKVIVSK